MPHSNASIQSGQLAGGTTTVRPYGELAARVAPIAELRDRMSKMQALVDLAWDALAATSVSWLGFYLAGEPGEMLLGPRRDKPACSPIGLHGVCGQSFTSGSAWVVRDVKVLGADYIACDPRDRSEVVVPCFERGGPCWGVFDLDSFDAGAFAEADAHGLHELLRAAGLTDGARRLEVIVK